jgi:uncharacterized repeat protein (TIGR01451 family)
MTNRRAVAFLSLLFVSWAALARAVPLPPTITEPPTDGRILNPADVHMEARYSDPGGSPHVSTDWALWDTDAEPDERAWSRLGVSAPPNLLVHIHLGDGTFEGSYAGRTQLKFDTHYLLKVRFWNQNGQASAWSERPFRTSPQGPAGVPGPMPWVTRQPGYAVEVVATGFQLPVNIAFVPSPGPNPTDPFLYVTELYGTIKVVLRDGTVADYATGLLNFNPTGAFPGSGEQGLTGIVVDPPTGNVYASLLYEYPCGPVACPENPTPHYAKVLRFTSTDGGRTAATQTTVLDMFGEPFAESHQISNLTIGPGGELYVHTGDGFDSTTASDLDSFRGKILRAKLDGTAPEDNPFYDGPPITARDYVYAYGMRNPFGGAWRSADGAHYQLENGPSVDRIAKVVAGRDFGWDGTDASMSNFALYNWDPSRAPVNLAFIQPGTFAGSGFPFAKMDHAYVSESGPTYAAGPQDLGKRIVEFVFDAAEHLVSGPTTLVEYNGTGRATAVGLAAGPDGLYFTDLYKDQDSEPPNPIERGANLLRIRYNAATGSDLVITKTDGETTKAPGTSVTYTITASNAGPEPVAGATVTDVIPAAITGVGWTCAGAGGGTCTAAGAGNLSDGVDLPVGGSVTYMLTGTIDASATGTLSNTATVTLPNGMMDPVPGNNSATDTDRLTDDVLTRRRPRRLPGVPLPAAAAGTGAPARAVGPVTTSVGDGAPGVASTLTTSDARTIDSSGLRGTARVSSAATGTVAVLRAPLGHEAGGPVTFTPRSPDATQFSPAWSTKGPFDTCFSFSNTTDAPVSGSLILLDATGMVAYTLPISIPAGQTAGVSTVSLGVARNRKGTARFTHEGPPGSIRAKAVIAKESVVAPACNR